MISDSVRTYSIFFAAKARKELIMNPLNSALIEGNVVRAPQVTQTPKGTFVCKFSMATNRKYKTDKGEFEEEVSFFDVETWGHLAEVCAELCEKGRGIRVVGRLKQGRWKDENGKNCSKVGIVAEHVDFKPRLQGKTMDKSPDSPELKETPDNEDRKSPQQLAEETFAELNVQKGAVVF